MVLNVTASGLGEEIRHAIEVRDDHLEAMGEMVERYHGPYWKGSEGRDDYAPENFYYQYVSLMTPRLVYDNPRVRVTSRRALPRQPNAHADLAEAIRHGLNRWVRDIELRKHCAEVAVDMLFNYGVMLVREEEREGVSLPTMETTMPSRPTWPVVERVPQNKFFMDPGIERWQDARFLGHEFRRDKDDLIAEAERDPDAGWNTDMIEELASDSDPRDYEETDEGYPYRGEVHCYEIWVPEYELEDSPGPKNGYHGTLFTLGVGQQVTTNPADRGGDDSQTVEFIREPRPYYGPRWGPYVVYGVYKVPNSPWPLSPLVAVEGQIEDTNTHVLAASMSMQKHKRIVGTRDARTAQMIKNLQHDYVCVVPFEDGKAQVEQIELAGHTEHQNDWIAQSRDRTERILGMDEAMTGSVTGEGTATEHSIASEASSTRIAYVKQAFADATSKLLMSAAYYMYHSDTVVFPLGDDARREMGLPQEDEPWFRGGDEDVESGYSFDDLELEIEPFSMERTNEGLNQKRMLETHQLMLATLPLMAQFPDFPWQVHFRKLGDAMNIPGMEDLASDDMLARLAGDLLRLQQSEAQVAQAPMSPMLSKHLAGVRPPGQGGITIPGPRPVDQAQPIGQFSGAAAGTNAQ